MTGGMGGARSRPLMISGTLFAVPTRTTMGLHNDAQR